MSALDAAAAALPYSRPTSRRTGCERDEYPSSVGTETRWLVETGATAAGNGPGSLRTQRRKLSRLRRRAPAIQGSADRPRKRPVGQRVRHRRMRVAPRKARPFVPGRLVALDSRTRRGRAEATDMTTTDPLSLTEAKRLVPNADTILLRATRPADLQTPIWALLRLDDGNPAYLLESVEGGERLDRYSFLGVGPRRLLEVRGNAARIQDRPVSVPVYSPDLPVETVPATDPLAAIRAFVPRRRGGPTEGMPRFPGGAVGALAYDAVTSFEPTVPLPDRDPVGVPTAAFIETDLVLVFDHLPHTLSAIASLHTDAPHLEARYRIAETAI